MFNVVYTFSLCVCYMRTQSLAPVASGRHSQMNAWILKWNFSSQHQSAACSWALANSDMYRVYFLQLTLKKKGDTPVALLSLHLEEPDQCFGSVWTGIVVARRHCSRLCRLSLPLAVQSHHRAFLNPWLKDSPAPDDDISSSLPHFCFSSLLFVPCFLFHNQCSLVLSVPLCLTLMTR